MLEVKSISGNKAWNQIRDDDSKQTNGKITIDKIWNISLNNIVSIFTKYL